MKSTFVFLALLTSVTFAQVPKNKVTASAETWQPLFNGKDLTGWDVKIAGHELNDNYKNTFLVEDGMLRVNYKEYQQFDNKYGHLYYKQPYSFYKIRFEYRFQGDQVKNGAPWNVRNSGIMLHSQAAETLGKDQDFPISLEMQLLGGLGKGPRHTGNLCTPGTIVEMNGKPALDHCIDSKSKTYDGDQWVKAEAIVLGDSVVYQLIEGDTVLTYYKTKIGGGYVSNLHTFKDGKVKDAEGWIAKDNTPLSEGYIALQAESHAIDFKNVELLNLKGCRDPKAVNYKSNYVADDRASCRYQKK